jgi:hypothetical protein
MQVALQIAARPGTPDDVRQWIHTTRAALEIAAHELPRLVQPQKVAPYGGTLAGHRCLKEGCTLLLMRGHRLPHECYICPHSGVVHECGAGRCALAVRSDTAKETCPLTMHSWDYHDEHEAIEHEDRNNEVIRGTYKSKEVRLVDRLMSEHTADEALLAQHHHDAVFIPGHLAHATADYTTALTRLMQDSKLLPTPETTTTAATATAASASASVTEAESARQLELHDRATAKARETLARDKEAIKRKRLEERQREGRARKPMAKRGTIRKPLRPVSEKQHLKHLGAFELDSRRIPKDATRDKLKDSMHGIPEITTIVNKVFGAELSRAEWDYLFDRCKTLWKLVVLSPAYASKNGDFDMINTFLFVMFHGMRRDGEREGVHYKCYQCEPQAWSYTSTADIAHAADRLGIINKLSAHSERIFSMLAEIDELAEAEIAETAAATAVAALTSKNPKPAIWSWRVSTGETYEELARRFMTRSANPQSMPNFVSPFCAAARFPRLK